MRAHIVTSMTRPRPYAWCRAPLLIVLSICALAIPASASADTVRDWNRHALEALSNPTNPPVPGPVPGAAQSPTVTSIHMAMVQGAVYDAVNSIDRGHQAYLAGLPPAPRSASQEAAVATAAHHVLVGLGGGLVPALPQVVRDRLDVLYAEALAGIPNNGTSKEDGIAAGAAAAAAMLAARSNDGRYEPFSFPVGADAGEWRPVLPAFVSDPFAWVANVEPFLLESSSQFRTKGPRALTSDAYAREYNEVKELGGPTVGVGNPRTPEQEAVAQFYTVNVIELLNRTFRTISEAEGLTLAEEARLFGMLNLAGADSVIHCWDEKAFWSFWRPITAIQEGDNDTNPDTVGQSNWTPLIATPPYPEHTSGYNCASGAYMHTAKAFFGGNRMEFSVVKFPGNVTPNPTRNYGQLTAVVKDTIDARVYQGIHFRAADVQGVALGKDVAHWLDKHYFQPVG
jgi:hypothetical protein